VASDAEGPNPVSVETSTGRHDDNRRLRTAAISELRAQSAALRFVWNVFDLFAGSGGSALESFGSKADIKEARPAS